MMPMMPGMPVGGQAPIVPPAAAHAAESPEASGKQKITSAVVPISRLYNKHKVDGIATICPAVALAGDRRSVCVYIYIYRERFLDMPP